MRDGQTKGLGGLEVDDQLERGRLLDRQFAGLGPLENLVDVSGGMPKAIGEVRTIGHEAARGPIFPAHEHRGQPVFERKVDELPSGVWRDGVADEDRVDPSLRDLRDGIPKIVTSSYRNDDGLKP